MSTTGILLMFMFILGCINNGENGNSKTSKETMETENPQQNGFDLSKMLEYQGVSTRQESDGEDWLGLIDVVDSDRNERVVGTLLSAAGIAFYLQRATGWKGAQKYLTVSVAPEDFDKMIALLNAAKEEKLIDFVEEGSYR